MISHVGVRLAARAARAFHETFPYMDVYKDLRQDYEISKVDTSSTSEIIIMSYDPDKIRAFSHVRKRDPGHFQPQGPRALQAARGP